MNWLGYINEQMTSIIDYQFNYWNGELTFPYWVGEYQETEYDFDIGYHEYSFTLTGTSNTTYATLEKDKEKIIDLFKNHTSNIEKGHSIAIFYDNSLMIPSQDESIKRMEIHLTVKEWIG